MSYIGNLPTNTAFVTDQFNGDGSTVAFTMSVAPASTSSILVAITGVLQDPSTYAVSGTTLTFSSAPPVGTGSISVRYLGIPASGITTTAYRTVTEFTATAGQTTFSVPSYTVGYIDVYRNGSRLNSADYTASTGTTVVLAAACNAGDSVTTESFYVSSVLNAIPATAGAVNSTYITDSAVTTAKIADANVTQAKLAAGLVNGPAFSAYAANVISTTSGTITNMPCDTEAFDTNGCYNNTGSTVTLNGISTPAYAFAPNVAGYYQVTGGVSYAVSGQPNSLYGMIYKNGSVSVRGTTTPASSSSTYPWAGVSDLVYCNGTSDYIQFFATQQIGTLNINNTADGVYFKASFVRSA